MKGIDFLDLIQQIVRESPYLSIDMRKDLAKEVHMLSTDMQEGRVAFTQAEKKLSELNHKAAENEIQTLMAKIHHLNPSSPRLNYLRSLAGKLKNGEISANQARIAVHELMLAIQ